MPGFSTTSLPPIARVGDSADIVGGLRRDTSVARPPRFLALKRALPITVPAEPLLKLESVPVKDARTRSERRQHLKRKPRRR